jgi:hypothetical protein
MSEVLEQKQSQKRPYVRKKPFEMTPARQFTLAKANLARISRRADLKKIELLNQINKIQQELFDEEEIKEEMDDDMIDNESTEVQQQQKINETIEKKEEVKKEPEIQKEIIVAEPNVLDSNTKRKRDEEEIKEQKEEIHYNTMEDDNDDEQSYDDNDMVEEIQGANELQNIMQQIRQKTIPSAPLVRESSIQRQLVHKAPRPDPTVAFLEHTQHFNAFTQHPSRLISSSIPKANNSTSSYIWI